MCKLFLISVILTSSLSFEKDLNVVKFVEDCWEKLVAEGRTRRAPNRGDYYVNCARVQTSDVLAEREQCNMYNLLYELFCPKRITAAFMPNNAFQGVLPSGQCPGEN
ncbi:Protein of unknown function [Cotesia congregata]|uniref:Uncharacterized protein n=1 Tax=Cotesia congregata TaxID=51543 RepID=A0A8J2H4Z9_COTCN|nr:Protein of unknown function [Cotesia congregata]